MSLADLAKKSGVSIGWLSKVENGDDNITVKILRQIAFGLAADPSWLLSTAKPQQNSQ